MTLQYQALIISKVQKIKIKYLEPRVLNIPVLR